LAGGAQSRGHELARGCAVGIGTREEVGEGGEVVDCFLGGGDRRGVVVANEGAEDEAGVVLGGEGGAAGGHLVDVEKPVAYSCFATCKSDRGCHISEFLIGF
jgi:hypothetical protein